MAIALTAEAVINSVWGHPQSAVLSGNLPTFKCAHVFRSVNFNCLSFAYTTNTLSTHHYLNGQSL